MPKSPASGASVARHAAPDRAAGDFNGADPASFDHDGDGRPGGSVVQEANAVRGASAGVPVVEIATGALHLLPSASSAVIDGQMFRHATRADVAIGGRPEWSDLVVEPPSDAGGED